MCLLPGTVAVKFHLLLLAPSELKSVSNTVSNTVVYEVSLQCNSVRCSTCRLGSNNNKLLCLKDLWLKLISLPVPHHPDSETCKRRWGYWLWQLQPGPVRRELSRSVAQPAWSCDRHSVDAWVGSREGELLRIKLSVWSCWTSRTRRIPLQRLKHKRQS